MLRFRVRLTAVLLFLLTAGLAASRAADDRDNKPAPDASAPAQEGVPDKAATKPGPDSKPVTGGKIENTLGQAKKDNEGVAIWLERVQKGHAKIKVLIEQYRVGDTKHEGLVLTEFRDQIQALARVANELENRGPAFEKDLQLYEASLKKGEATYQELAGLYQQKAVDSKDPRYQKLYRHMSDTSSAWANVMGKNRSGIDGTRKNAKKLLEEVGKSRAVLEDLSAFLDVHIQTEELASVIAKFYDDIKAYNQELDQTVQNISEWLQKQADTSGDTPAPKSRPAA
jgi:hypothetical protein